jgi:hypothetical protein
MKRLKKCIKLFFALLVDCIVFLVSLEDLEIVGCFVSCRLLIVGMQNERIRG